MAAGAVIKHKRKAGAFVNGELQAGEKGLDVSAGTWYFSRNGTTVETLGGSSDASTLGGVAAANYATKTYADTAASTAVAAAVDAAPSALDTLNELAAALGDDANFAATMTTALADKAAASHTHAANTITAGTMSNAGIIIDGGTI